MLSATRSGFDPKAILRQVGSSSQGFDSPEFLVDTNISLLPEPRYQEDAAMAFGGANSLVVWSDSRMRLGAIRGTRMTPGGSVLEPDGITITRPRDTVRFFLSGYPAVVFGGGEFLVAWQAETYANNIYCMRVSTDGVVLDSVVITVSALDNDQMYPSVCWDGVNFLVVWIDRFSGSWRVRGARVSPEGQVLDTSGFVISGDTADGNRPSVAFDGTNFLVVWSSAFDIYGARVTPGGALLDSPAIAISRAPNTQQYPAVSWDGSNFLVVWQDKRTDEGDIYGARVTPGGIVLDTAGLAVSRAASMQWFPAIAFDGANYLVIWLDYRDTLTNATFCARVAPDGTVLDTSGVCVSPAGEIRNPQGPAVNFGGTNFGVVWLENSYRTGYDVYGARVTPEAQVLDSTPLVLSTVVADQGAPAVCFGSSDFLVGWQDHRTDSTCDIMAARISGQGEPLDSGGIVVSAARYNQTSPALASDGEDYLVTWSDFRSGSESDIYGARATTAGDVLDPQGIPISTAARNQGPSAVASDGSEYLVVWQDFRVGSWDVYGARVSLDGVVEDTSGIPISVARRYQENPAISFVDTDYLVVWQDLRADNFDIYGARVSPDGTVRDTAGIPISTAIHDQVHPAIAFDGTNSLVAWLDHRNDVSWQIFCARVTPEGVTLDTSGIPIPVLAGEQVHPAVSFDGTSFLIVWQDSCDTSWDIRGARVSAGGVVMDTFSVATGAGNRSYPALAHGTGSQVLLAYQGWAGIVDGRTYNTDRIWGKLGPFTGIASETSTQPETRFLAVEPNPVRNACRVSFSLSEPGNVSLKLYDVTGRQVTTLANGCISAGNHVTSVSLAGLAHGIYLLRLESADCKATRKLILE